MADFSHYGGPSGEWLAVEKTLPAPVANQTLTELVEITNKTREAVSAQEMVDQGLIDKVDISYHTIPTRDSSSVEATIYRPKSSLLGSTSTNKLPIYINLHGGGFLFGTSRSEDSSCSRIVANLAPTLPMMVINVNYRHTPTHVYPVAWEDVEDAFEWIHENLEKFGGDGEKVVMGGISAGGQLTASFALAQHMGRTATKRPRLRGQVLIIPCLIGMDCYDEMKGRMKAPEVWSVQENEFAPVLPLARMKMFTELLKVERQDPKDRRLCPGYATDQEVRGLPPTVFGIAGLDPLRDEALLYAQQLAANGVPTDVSLFKGVPHGFRRFGDRLSESKHWDDVIVNGIRWALSEPAATAFEVKTR